MWAERKAFVKIINEYRKELGYESLARANVDSFSEPADISLDYLPRDTSNLSETCRNYLLLRDSILKDTQIQQQQDAARKIERSRDVSIEEITPPAKRPVHERLGSRENQPPPAPRNTPAPSEVDLSTKFMVDNDSFNPIRVGGLNQPALF